MARRRSDFMTPEESLDAFVSALRFDESGCWIWTGALDRSGYGSLNRARKTWTAHRFSYVHFVGEPPVGTELDHLCRVTMCVNPDHLEPVPPRVNNLRSNGMAARHARQTHCINGHEFTPSNTRIVVNPYKRVCRACTASAQRRYQERRQAGLESRGAA